MKMIVLSVYDKATEAYMRPWFAQTPGQAVRMFEDEVLRDGSDVGLHPHDYTLYQIGSFTDHNGELLPLSPPMPLRHAHEVTTNVHNLEQKNA